MFSFYKFLVFILFPQKGIKNLDIFFMCSPVYAAMAIEAGIREIAIQEMKYFPKASQLQKYSRLMICKFVVMNTENRWIFLTFILNFKIISFFLYIYKFFLRMSIFFE